MWVATILREDNRPAAQPMWTAIIPLSCGNTGFSPESTVPMTMTVAMYRLWTGSWSKLPVLASRLGRRGIAVLVVVAVGVLIIAALGVLCLAAYKIKAGSFEFSAAILKLFSFSIKIISPDKRGRSRGGQLRP